MSQMQQCKCDGCGKIRKNAYITGAPYLKEQVGWVRCSGLSVLGEDGFQVDFSGDFCSMECMKKHLDLEMFKRL